MANFVTKWGNFDSKVWQLLQSTQFFKEQFEENFSKFCLLWFVHLWLFFLQLNDEMSQKMLTWELFRKYICLGLLDYKFFTAFLNFILFYFFLFKKKEIQSPLSLSNGKILTQ